MRKKKSNITISFVNEPAAEIVTGSLVHIKTEKHNILLDAGFYQSSNIEEDYKINNRTLKNLKLKDIDFIILSHNHGDHIFYAPVLFKRNCRARVLVPSQSVAIMKEMLLDCAHINEKNAAYLSMRNGKEYEPLFNNEDVGITLRYTEELPVHKRITLDDDLMIEFIPSGHLLKGCQILLYLKDGNQWKTVLYTGDLGNKYLRQPFTEKFEAVKKANIVIAESTYGKSKDVRITQKERDLDLKKIKEIVQKTVFENHSRVLFPVFAQARTETVLYLLYKLYGNDPKFKTNIYIDSPLACRIFNLYPRLLPNDAAHAFSKIFKWQNVHLISKPEDSINLVASDEPCIILSSSGMCSNGRVKYHLKSLLGNPNAAVIFTGYSTEGSLAYKLKQENVSYVACDNEEYHVCCTLDSLQSLSSHIPYFAMLEYYTSIHCNQLILHHGNMDGKLELKKDLDDLFAQKYMTTKVIAANRETIIEL